MKVLISTLLIALVAHAATLPKGSLMCVSDATVKKLVQLKRAGKSAAYGRYARRMLMLGACTRTSKTMDPNSHGRKDLGGGVTRMGTMYIATDDIK